DILAESKLPRALICRRQNVDRAIFVFDFFGFDQGFDKLGDLAWLFGLGLPLGLGIGKLTGQGIVGANVGVLFEQLLLGVHVLDAVAEAAAAGIVAALHRFLGAKVLQFLLQVHVVRLEHHGILTGVGREFVLIQAAVD